MREKAELNNKGFSLIELLVSIAIAGIVIVSAFSVILYGMDRYSKSSRETKLQSEIQFTTNIISDAVKTGSSSSSRIEITRDGSGKVSKAYVYTSLRQEANGEPADDGVGYARTGMLIMYDATKNSIYAIEPGGSTAGNTRNLVSDCIESFDCSYLKTEEGQDVGINIGDPSSTTEVYYHESDLMKFNIEYKVGELTRTLSNTYKIRNK